MDSKMPPSKIRCARFSVSGLAAYLPGNLLNHFKKAVIIVEIDRLIDTLLDLVARLQKLEGDDTENARLSIFPPLNIIEPLTSPYASLALKFGGAQRL